MEHPLYSRAGTTQGYRDVPGCLLQRVYVFYQAQLIIAHSGEDTAVDSLQVPPDTVQLVL